MKSMMRTKGVVFAFVGMSIAGMTSAYAASASDRNLIIGGVEVDQGDPVAETTVVITTRDTMGTSICTGSIVANDLVVTAGHCVGSSPSLMRIGFKRDLGAKGAFIPVKGFVRHPKYVEEDEDDQDMYDIALIRFEGGLPQGYSVASLLERASDLRDGDEVTLAGYGIANGDRLSKEAQESAGVLRKVDVTVLKAKYGKTEVLLDQTHGKGACHGDSGGPAFAKRKGELLLFGVTSRGPQHKPDNCASEAIYTNILAHKAFLKSTAAKLRKAR